MKRFLLIDILFFLLTGCASTKFDYGSSDLDEKHKEGLKYSIESYSQSIDILTENSVLVLKENDSTNTKPHTDSISTQMIKNNFGVQIASFRNEMNARDYLKNIRNKNLKFKFYIIHYNNFWRVITGTLTFRYEAEDLLFQLRNKGFSDAWIVQF